MKLITTSLEKIIDTWREKSGKNHLGGGLEIYVWSDWTRVFYRRLPKNMFFYVKSDRNLSFSAHFFLDKIRSTHDSIIFEGLPMLNFEMIFSDIYNIFHFFLCLFRIFVVVKMTFVICFFTFFCFAFVNYYAI